jgi:hypothetical protein
MEYSDDETLAAVLSQDFKAASAARLKDLSVDRACILTGLV